MRIAIAMICALTLMGVGAAAQRTPGDDSGRYIARSVDGGVLRIDRETGATSICREDADGWACRAVPDDREALEDEIVRLADENAALARRVDDLEERLAAVEPEALPPPVEGESESELPSDAEIDRMMDSFERMMRRFLGIVRSLKDDFEGERL